MQPISRGSATKAAAAVGLLMAGLACAGLFRIVVGSEHHAWASGAVAPQAVHVTEGKTYQLSVAGGVHALERQGADVSTAQCTYQAGSADTQSLAAQPSGSGTKATNVVATFVAPVTGNIHIDCAGWGALFVDNADNAPADLAGGLLVVAVIALTLGFGLGVSALRSAGEPGASGWTPGEDDEIERLVHLVHVRSEDREIRRPDGDDVLP